MVLKIMTNKEEGLNSICLSPSEFADKSYHPFIATTEFDKVVIELSSDIPTGYISQFVSKANKVIPYITEKNSATVQQLCEIIPDKSAEIRFTYMRNRNKFQELLDNLSATYNWNEELKC